MKIYLKSCLVLLAVVLASCASVGLTPAKSFDERLAYAVGTHTAVLRAATTSLQSGAITSSEAGQVLKMADDSRLILDGVRMVGDTPTGNSNLILATTALQALQTYLNSRSKK